MCAAKMSRKRELVSTVSDETEESSVASPAAPEIPKVQSKDVTTFLGGPSTSKIIRKAQNTLLWSHFSRTGPKNVECRHCKTTLKTTDASTTPLHAHLKNKHKTIYAAYVAEKSKEDLLKIDHAHSMHTAIATREQNILKHEEEPKPRLLNQDIREALGNTKPPVKYKSNSKCQLKADMDIATFLVTTNQPINLVEDPGFIRFVEAMDPRINVKSKSTFIRKKCPLLYENVKSAVEKVLEADLLHCDGVAFTSDTWTSRSNDPYQSLTLHYVSKNFELKKFTVDCRSFRGRHTGEAISALCDEMIKSIPGLRKDASRFATTDSGANMLKGMDLSTEINRNIRCIDHILNTCVTKALEEHSIQKPVAQCKQLASLSHRSSICLQKIQKACEECSPPVCFRKIIQPVCTRWNSLYYCIESIIAMKFALINIKVAEEDTELAKAIPNETGFKILEHIMKPLDEIRRASEILSSDKKPTIHYVLCYLATLQNLELKYGSVGKEAKDLCRVFTENLNKRVPNKGKDEHIYCVANLLHPRFKGSVMKLDGDSHTFEATKTKIIQEQKLKLHVDIDSTTAEPENITPKNGFRLRVAASIWEELEEMTEEFDTNPQMQEKTVSDLERELNVYLEHTPRAESADIDVLAWWKSHHTQLPNLANLARHMLCVPASSASSERVFSTSGNIITPQRQNLDPKNLEMLVYVKENFNYIKIPKWNFQIRDNVAENEENSF